MSTVAVVQSVKSFNHFTSFAELNPALNWITHMSSSHMLVFSSSGGSPVKEKEKLMQLNISC